MFTIIWNDFSESYPYPSEASAIRAAFDIAGGRFAKIKYTTPDSVEILGVVEELAAELGMGEFRLYPDEQD